MLSRLVLEAEAWDWRGQPTVSRSSAEPLRASLLRKQEAFWGWLFEVVGDSCLEIPPFLFE